MYTLNDVCKLITDGSHFSPEDEGNGYPMLSVKDMEDDDFKFSDCKRVGQDAFEKLLANGCKPLINDVVVAKDGSYLKTAFPIKDDRDIALLSSIAILRPDTDIVNPSYLSYFLKSETVFNTVSLNYISGTALKRIILKGIKKIPISLPDIDEQIYRVKLLDSARRVIKQRKNQLELLDNLIKARFVELFGDPITNPMGWKKEETNNHIDLLSGYPFKSEQYVDEGINICGGLIIMPQRIEWESCVHWPAVQGYEDYLLEDGDIVMALDRPWITEGFKVARVDDNHLPALLIQRTARIRALDINQDYLYYCFINGGFDKHSNVTGSLVPHISAKDIRSFEIMVPPIELQEEFSKFMKQVDKSKVVIQQSLDETQKLFDSLMQEYFG